jgi:hypothetical protein
VQAVVDAEHALIVAHAVTAEATDNTSLQPMAEAAREVLGQPTSPTAPLVPYGRVARLAPGGS